MLKVGFGLNAWAKGLSKNHLDGVGVYSRELYQSFLKEYKKDIQVIPYVFGEFASADFSFASQPYPFFLRHVLKQHVLGINLQSFNADLIHAPDHMIPALKNRAVIATIHDVIPLLHPEWASSKKILRYVKNALFKKTILSAQHIITISQHSKNDLVNYLNIPEERISVTPLAVNQAFYKRISEEDKSKVLNSYSLKPNFFLFVGTLQPRKNLEACLDAHAMLNKDERLSHPLVIVGNMGWCSEALLLKIKNEEEKGFVRWLSGCSDFSVKCFLQSAIGLVFVSLYEGFGMPILEAFASKCPVITSNVTSMPEVAGDAGILVDPYNIESIGSAMQSLIYSEDLRNNLTKLGLEKATEFTWQNCAKLTTNVYQKVK